MDEDSLLWMTFHHNSRLACYRPPLADSAVVEMMAAFHPVLSYEEAEAHRQVDPTRLQDTELGKILIRRRTADSFGVAPIDGEHLDRILTTGYGITAPRTELPPRRAVPSAGALYPAELYVIARNISGVTPGIWHYNPLESRIELIDSRTESVAAVDLAFVQPGVVTQSAAIVIITMAFERQTFKYGARGYRFALIEAGHIGQNIILTATELGLAAMPIGGLYEHLVDQILGIDGLNQGTVYAVALGTIP